MEQKYEATEPRTLVANSYDTIAETYAAWASGIRDPGRDAMTAWLLDHVSPGAPVLDLGCGNGEPTARRLAERFAVTGVDGSAAQIARARRAVPGARFQVADFTRLSFPAGSFAAIVALYSITHVPRTEHAALFRRLHDWLEPGGVLIATLGAHDTDGAVEDWLGAPMYFSHFDAATNCRLLIEAGFSLERASVTPLDEHGALVEFLGVIARRPAGDRPREPGEARGEN